jgi:hypothetical protein
VFYRPTALKCYLYQIDPDLYRTTEEKDANIFIKTFRYPGYRNLYLLILLISLLLAFSISGLLTPVCWLQSGSVKWWLWSIDVALCAVLGMFWGRGLDNVLDRCTTTGASGLRCGVIGGVVGGMFCWIDVPNYGNFVAILIAISMVFDLDSKSDIAILMKILY